MLHHYVMLKYTKNVTNVHVEDFCARMRNLTNQIPEVLEVTVGIDEFGDSRSWSLILDMRFSSIEALRQYQKHPEHIKLMNYNQPHVLDIASVDFTMPEYTT